MTEYDTVQIDPVEPPYDKTEAIIKKYISIANIKKIRFMEEWYFDSSLLTFEKKVIGFAPVLCTYKGSGDWSEKALFWILKK